VFERADLPGGRRTGTLVLMIVVLGRPRAARVPVPGSGRRLAPAGLAVQIARGASAAGSPVQLVGTVGDDPAGDDVAVGLELAGVGHAALLRDPAIPTPGSANRDERMPHLDRADVELGLRYLLDVRVVVLSEPLAPDTEEAVLEAATFHGAAVVAVVPAGAPVSARLGNIATVLEAPREGDGPFALVLGRFAAELDHGAAPGAAFEAATRAIGWESRTARGVRA
jgi:hypothetical protein